MRSIKSLPIRILFALLGLSCAAREALAIPVLYHGTGQLDFSEHPVLPDFFGPGSLPFEGTVYLSGVPSGPGGADTIIERGPVNGGIETVPIELVAMELRSAAPIEVSFGTASSFFDVFVHLDPTPASSGQMQLQQTSPSGGLIMDSFFDVFYTIEFVPVLPGSSLMLSGFPGPMAPPMPNIPVPLSYLPPPGYPGPSGFYPDTQTFVQDGPLSLTLTPVPEPSGVVLAGCGLALLAAIVRRRHGPRGRNSK